MPAGWTSFVALGDSFTEGMDDLRPDGTYRGWADLVASRLAGQVPGFRYANLAVRGRLFGEVADEQLPLALAMRPALVSFAAGGNDALRRNFDPATIIPRLDRVVADLVDTGATVLLLTGPDGTFRLPARNMIQRRAGLLNDAIRATAARHGTLLADCWPDESFADVRLWSDDRLHLGEAGHRRVAAKVLNVLGLPAEPDWMATLPPATPAPWLSARRDDLRWVRQHFAPWVGRRLRGRSSGDATAAKRPELAPLDTG